MFTSVIARSVVRMGLAARIGAVMCFALVLLSQLPLHAGFTGDYSINKFQLTNNNADGMVQSLFGGDVAVLYGGNTGSGLGGTTDLTIDIPLTGLVHFEYAYSSFDLPGYDQAGFLLNGLFTFLADTDGQGGVVGIPVVAGDNFGFRVLTEDNQGEPGILTLMRFSAPGMPIPAIPEPATFWLTVVPGVLFILTRTRSR